MSDTPVVYEALLVFKPVLDTDAADANLRTVEEAIQNLQGRVLKTEKVGRKRLAYEMGSFKDGLITVLHLELPQAAVVPFRKACQLNEEILRLTLLRLEEPDKVNPASTTVSGPAYGGRDGRDAPRGDRRPGGPRMGGGGFGGPRPPMGAAPAPEAAPEA